MMGKKSRVQYCISQHQRDLVVVRGSLQTTKTRSKKIFLEKSIRNLLFVHSLYGVVVDCIMVARIADRARVFWFPLRFDIRTIKPAANHKLKSIEDTRKDFLRNINTYGTFDTHTTTGSSSLCCTSVFKDNIRQVS